MVEARGVLCPVPIIRLARAASALPPGSLVELLSDDPAAALDVPAWCRLRGHTLVAVSVLGPEATATPAVGTPAPGTEPAVGRPPEGQALRHLIRVEAPVGS